MHPFRIVIQCRLSSTRLPGKALLPVAGMPAVILCVHRAANIGAHVVVATSTDASDDSLQQLLQRNRIPVFRGPLSDVLKRYTMVTSDMSDRDYVVRLTADNLFPDGHLVRGIVRELEKCKGDYISTSYQGSPLPYGLSVEAFTVKALRMAEERAHSHGEREHVTSWMKHNLECRSFVPNGFEKPLGHLRCTLDDFDDYLRLLSVFQNVEDPIHVDWKDLCHRLLTLSDSQIGGIPIRVRQNIPQSELTLGTAQFGSTYGVTNVTGQPSEEESFTIIRKAIRCGVTQIDCAREYGDAEKRVGLSLESGPPDKVQVITKLDPMLHLSNPTQAEILSLVDASIYNSCRELRLHRLPFLLLHRWAHQQLCDGLIWKRLLELQREGVIENLGASVITPQEAIEALEDSTIRMIQIPFNVIDWRWRAANFESYIKRRPDVIVHARSVFLQGVLATDVSVSNPLAGADVERWRDKLNGLVFELGRKNRADLCIAYVRAQNWIDSLVIGMESLSQLRNNVVLFQEPRLTMRECEQVETALGTAPEMLINPSLWGKK